jgi:hypothetical protein
MTVQTFFTIHGYYVRRILKGSLLRRNKKAYGIISLIAALLVMFSQGTAFACNGTDVTFSSSPITDAVQSFKGKDGTISYYNGADNLLVSRELPKISPSRARSIAEGFVSAKFPQDPPALTFRKLEFVHGKLIYQFRSEKIEGMDIQYHLGPVNFTVDHLVLDVLSRKWLRRSARPVALYL